jgi:acyl-CoA thioester hydrolase
MHPEPRLPGSREAMHAGDAFANGVHVFAVRVYYEDTDAGGVVYHANYLQFAERARTEMLRCIGLQQSRLLADEGIAFVVRRCIVDFLAPARLDDHLLVATRLKDLRGASLDLEQTVSRDDLALARLQVRVACMAIDGRPKRLPRRVRAAFDEFTRTLGIGHGT